MQLQALLDSVELHTKGFFNNIDVVYLATDDRYKQGYEILKTRRPQVNYITESNFEKDIKSCFKMEYTCMAADDDIIFRDFNKGLFRVFEDPEVGCFSLRLGLNIDYCYSNDKPNKLKKYQEDGEFIHWNWREEELDFAYPLSVISHIFRTDFIKGLTDKISFKDTNIYEGTLQRMIQECPSKMYAYKESKIVGVPANSVNSSWTNRHGLQHSYSTEELIDRYINGETIDVTKVDADKIHSAQQELKYEFK